MNARSAFLLGAIYAGVAVLLGSLGAHALKATLAAHDSARAFEIGRDYLAYHGLVLMLMSLADSRWPTWQLMQATRWIAMGAGIFSTALFAFSLSGEKLFAHAAPVGGALMIFGWVLVVWCGLRHRAN